MSILNIAAIGGIGNKNWIKTEDGKWHHLCIYDDGAIFVNGKLVPSEPVGPVGEVNKPSKKRWEILDIR